MNPGEVWEENEFWMELTWRIDPDGSLGIRQFVESKKKPGERLGVDEYYEWIFENSVPGLPEKASSRKSFAARVTCVATARLKSTRRSARFTKRPCRSEELEDVARRRFGRVFTRAPKPASPNIVPIPTSRW